MEKKVKSDIDVFTFEKLFKEWKNSFFLEYINNLKKSYGISENIQTVKIRLYDKKQKKYAKNEIEFLKSSSKFRKYINENELKIMNPKLIMNNIDKIVKGYRFNLFGIEKEIDYSKLKTLKEE